MAALRIFARSKLSAIIRGYTGAKLPRSTTPAILQIQQRWGSYKSSPMYEDPSKHTDYEISKDPTEWEYVERLLKPKVVPLPPFESKEYPSGWKPPTAKPKEHPYFVQRTKNYMLPVYLEITFRGMRRVTRLSKIDGDIWTLNSELKAYLQENTNKPIGSRVNEFIGSIKFRGDYVSLVKKWLDMKGF